MLAPQDLQCSTILYVANEAELGIAVKTNDPYRARASLYKTRKLLADPTLASLQIRVSPDNPNGEIWIFKPSGVSGFDITKTMEDQGAQDYR